MPEAIIETGTEINSIVRQLVESHLNNQQNETTGKWLESKTGTEINSSVSQSVVSHSNNQRNENK